MLRRVALVRTDVSEEFSGSIIRVTRIGELETTLAELATDAGYEEMQRIKMVLKMVYNTQNYEGFGLLSIVRNSKH
jgi:hypothetical protein